MLRMFRVLIIVVAVALVSACSSTSSEEEVSGYIHASACAQGVCQGLAVPRVVVTITRGNRVVAQGVTDQNGYVKMSVRGAGEVTITCKSPFLKDGGFTNVANLQGSGAYGLDSAAPMASGITPGP